MNSFFSYIVIMSIEAILLETVRMKLLLGMTLLKGKLRKENSFLLKSKENIKI